MSKLSKFQWRYVCIIHSTVELWICLSYTYILVKVMPVQSIIQ